MRFVRSSEEPAEQLPKRTRIYFNGADVTDLVDAANDVEGWADWRPRAGDAASRRQHGQVEFCKIGERPAAAMAIRQHAPTPAAAGDAAASGDPTDD